MKVLLTITDLFENIGGGQTVYRKIVEASPDIDFYYFRVFEAEHAPRPSNVHALPLTFRRALRLNAPPPHVAYELSALEEADAIARSVAGETFDIVETPDFLTFGSALRLAFATHGVTVRRFVLAMHGNISTTIDLNWGSAGDASLELKLLERRQFEEADAVYGISQQYIREWRQIVDRNVHYIDPAHFVNATRREGGWIEAGRPSLYCIGRSERRKGNDIFAELVRWLDPESFGGAKHIGDVDYSDGVSSGYRLENIAKIRGIHLPHDQARSAGELAALYATPAIVVVPSRYDTLNLIALEALFSGCPVAISSRAGACDYLDRTWPKLPYFKLDLDDLYANVSVLRDLTERYDEHRRRLNEALAAHPPVPSAPLNMRAFYAGVLEDSSGAVAAGADDVRSGPSGAGAIRLKPALSYQEDKLSGRRRVLELARRLAPPAWKHRVRRFTHAPKKFVTDLLRDSGHFGDAHYFSVLLDAQWTPTRLRQIGRRTERNQDALKEKLGTLYFFAALSPMFRCNFWLDIARVERLRGQELMAAAYELRILRLLGRDGLGLLPLLKATLVKNGSVAEAQAADALYSDPATADERVYSLLKERFERLKLYQEKPWAIIDDRRAASAKVSVIVSLYKAADKLRFFLNALAQQTLVRQGDVEIVLVDSGSPTDERAVFEAFHAEHPLSMIYARSPDRESIQAAWNRGIKLAQAPYLVFLGVDETLYPEALEVLATELDKRPGTDWVMANSLVTAVDEKGLHKNDIMPYDRSGATKDHVYLETCYLSWVGGMYRRNIHERFGYYDEAFRGAGDTEFKNRILPHINVHFVDRMLGLFLNYPEGQTTASAMAEIEDSRAWYLYRTAGGVRYAFEDRPVEDAEALLRLCLGYRKSYCGHLSTDIEYGRLLADYILKRNPNSALAQAVAPGLNELLDQLRQLEFAWTSPSRFSATGTMIQAARAARRHGVQAAKAVGQSNYKLLNDNRYEQHSWLWKSI